MREKILVLTIVVLLGVGWISSNANAQGQVGLCNKIFSMSWGPTGQVNMGINVLENCNELLVILGMFQAGDCDLLPEGSLAIEKLPPTSAAIQNVCNAWQDTCGIPLDICPYASS